MDKCIKLWNTSSGKLETTTDTGSQVSPALCTNTLTISSLVPASDKRRGEKAWVRGLQVKVLKD